MATKKGAVDLLILTTVRKKIEYLELHTNYRTDNGVAKAAVKDTFSKVKASIDAGRKDPIEGVQYETTKAAPLVGVIYIEIEDATKEELADAQIWMKDVVAPEILRENPGTTDTTAVKNFRQGYTGTQISW